MLLATLDVHAPGSPAADAVDWHVLLSVARDAKLLPALAHRVLVGSSVAVPRLASEVLRAALEENAALNRRLLADLAFASATLGRAGIAHVALKGAVSIARDYPHPAMRQAGDVDILVDPARIEDAAAMLHAAGCVDAPHTRRLAPDGRSEAAAQPPGAHGWIPLEAPSGTHLDLHRRVPVRGYAATGGFRGWRDRAEAVVVDGVQVPACHPRDLAVHLCERFAWQEFGDPLEIPRLLADLRAAFRTAPPWASFAPGSRRGALALRAAKTLYEAAFDAHGIADARTRFLQGLAVADPAVTPLVAELANLRGQLARVLFDLAHRPRYALRTWFPTRAYLAERYRLDPDSPEVYSHYVRRLVVAAFKPWWRSR